MALAALLSAGVGPVATASAASLNASPAGVKGTPFFRDSGLKVKLHYADSADWLTISGDNLPARSGLKLELMFSNGNMQALGGTRVNADGGFSVKRAIGAFPIGTAFKVLALGTHGVKASSEEIVVER